MFSPKFRYALPALQKCIAEPKLASVWKHKVGAQLRKQIYLDLIEYKDYSGRIDAICKNICLEITEGSYRPGQTRQYLVEKSKGLCRQMTLLQPRDILIMQTISGFLYNDLKKHQPTTNSYFEPGDHKFNKGQLLYKGNEYGSVAAWKRFQQAIFNFSKERKWLVITDIANFYDFINFRHLRNIVASYCNTSEYLLDFLLFILNEISWVPDYMPRTGIGLPQIEIEAPRVLANAMLYELDKVASDHSGGDYARFMDDIDVGVDTLQQAKKIIRDIDLTLQTRQLRLNSSKTKILNSENGETADHFCIKENKFLDHLSKLIESKPTHTHHLIKAFKKAYLLWRGDVLSKPFKQDCRFFRGNGEKILKRMTMIGHNLKLTLPREDMLYLIWRTPGLRQHAFASLARLNIPNLAFYKLVELFKRNDFVDDQAIIYMANFAIHAKFLKTLKMEVTIQDFIKWCIDKNTFMHTYAALLLASKFVASSEIVKIAAHVKDWWWRDPWLGRCVAGIYPRVSHDSKLAAKFFMMIQESGNAEAIAVVEFHKTLQSNSGSLTNIAAYVKSPNPSFAHGLIHPKVLVILSVKQNPLSAPLLSQLILLHSILVSDPYLKAWFA